MALLLLAALMVVRHHEWNGASVWTFLFVSCVIFAFKR